MIQRVRGTRDLIPPLSRLVAAVEAEARRVFVRFGYEEVRLPILESTELFVRSVGETTDIVGKEMYTFADRKGRSLTLRPEGTAGVARAYLENGLGQWPQPVRVSYLGPMFRYEKMQRGRYRQFDQIGLELLGAATPLADLEVLLALHTFLEALQFDDLEIVLNNLGDPEDRARFVGILRSELEPRRDALCSDCRRRWDTNPLRILDCKVPTCREVTQETTPIAEVVSPAARAHVDELETLLEAVGLPVRRAPRLVRGLDYYVRTVFEVISPQLGESTVICGGGRYDRLISDLGGPEVPGIGFAIGTDRLVEIVPEAFRDRVLAGQPVAVVPVADGASPVAARLLRELTEAGVEVRVEAVGRSMKASLKWTGKIGARAALILGADEVAAHTVTVRDLERSEQRTVALDQAVSAVLELLETEATQ
jgi:histidyl-tRNA synthetase